MGFHGCWLAAKSIDESAFAERVGFALTGEDLEHPFDAPHSFGRLPSGWALCILSEWEDRLVQPDLLRWASAATDIVACSIDEASMTCSAQFWSGGRKVWEVVHDAQDNVNHLESAGEPLPASLELYRAKAAASHATDVEVDFMFDVPLLLARDITGFKHDEKLEEGAALFRIDLVSEKASTGMTGGQKAWWKFW